MADSTDPACLPAVTRGRACLSPGYRGAILQGTTRATLDTVRARIPATYRAIAQHRAAPLTQRNTHTAKAAGAFTPRTRGTTPARTAYSRARAPSAGSAAPSPPPSAT